MIIRRNHFESEFGILCCWMYSSADIFESLYVNKNIKVGDKVYGKVF